MIRIGTAGWAIPRAVAAQFPEEGSALARYASRFKAVEINSTFRRSHKPQTYARWAETVPATFRFAAKLPKTITHQRKLIDCAGLLDAFLYEIAPLGEKLGPLLVQLPPSLAFDMATVDSFLQALRARFAGRVVCEPRHPTWFDDDADAMLAVHGVARVAADPARTSEAGWPGGARDLAYFRLHGSPRMYFSAYGKPFLDDLAARLAAEAPAEAWCIFDNTASGAAAADALALKERLGV